MTKDILFITSYPEKGLTHGKKVVGVASYAKNTAVNLQKLTGQKITVLAETLNNSKKSYTEDGIEIERVWERDNPLSMINLARKAQKSPAKKTVVEFEFAMFGGIYMLPLLLLLLLFLNICGKQIYFVLHHVITDITGLAGHIGADKNSFKIKVFNKAIKFFYFALGRLTKKIIVFEKTHGEEIAKMAHTKNVVVIPHAVERFNSTISKKSARDRLNLPQDKKIALLFGFIAHYKGTDIGIENLKSSDWEIVVAGGPNPNHLEKKHYSSYINSIKKNNHTRVTGFVDEKDIPLYYKAADVAVFPYRAFMSSSGPLSIAYSTTTPFAISSNIKNTLKNQDVTAALKKSNINEKDLILQKNSYQSTLESVRKNHKKITEFEKIVKSQRSWKNIAKQYNEALAI